LIEIGSKTAEKNSAQTNRQTNRQTDRHYENNGHLAVNQKCKMWNLKRGHGNVEVPSFLAEMALKRHSKHPL